jgi:hypothetical protein
MHTCYSDGNASPARLALQAIYCGLDFAVLAEHNTLAGALEARRLLEKAHFAYPLTVGEEITMKWGHMNAYPLKDVISWKLSPYETVKAAHAQGAVVQWNHPGFPDDTWQTEHMKTGLEGVGTEAWEHVPFQYDLWKREGRCPLIVGTSDTHDGTFSDGECTIVWAASTAGDDVAEAIRWGQAVAVEPAFAKLFYGPDGMIARAWAALAEGKALKAAKADELKRVLEKADLRGIVQAAPTKPAPQKKVVK